MYTLGIDVGSTTSKVVILEDAKTIVASYLVKSGIGTSGDMEAFEGALREAGLQRQQMERIVATGYGRTSFEMADDTLSELSCHGKGVHFTFPQVRTVIDIGGQDAKVLKLGSSGKMLSFLMNDKCAAGTGRFLDVMAGILKLDISDLEKQALASKNPVEISSTCTVFAESEVISQLAAGKEVCDIVAGICNSVAARTASLVKRTGVTEAVCMSGGVAKNGGVREALERELGTTILVAENAQFMGALGAAIYGYEKSGRN